MPDLYPLFLDLRGRPCLVVGGGPVAERKVGGLLAAGARVTVVSPEVTGTLAARAERGDVRWVERGFAPGDLDGMSLAFVATSRADVNRAAGAEARARGVWLNRADDPGDCDFQVPAVLRRGPICAAVSTSGASPAAAAWVRDRLGEGLPPGAEEAVRVLGALREMTPAQSGTAPRSLLASGVAEDLARGDWERADEKIGRFFDGAPSVRELLGRAVAEKK